MDVVNFKASNNEIEPHHPAGGIRNYSWLKCMMGCEIDGRKAVTNLDCMHFLCSDECIEKVKSGTKPGDGLKCVECCKEIPVQQLLVKIIPTEAFATKKTAEDIDLICDYCIFDNIAVAYCPECPGYLCGPCKELHPQLRKTTTHKLEDDLTSLKIKELPKVLERESNCKIHDKRGDLFCRKCELRICQLCVPSHKEHETVQVATLKENLRSNIETARRLAKQCGEASVEIKKKREELQTSQRDEMKKLINDHFAMLIGELLKRENKMIEEIEGDFTELMDKLSKRVRIAEISKAYHERFVSIGEQIINDGAEMASVNFVLMYEKFFKELEKSDAWLSTHFDRFVERGGHFGLNESAVSNAKEFIFKYGGIKYKLQPGCEAVDDQQFESGLIEMNVVSVGSTLSETVERPTCKAVNVASVSANDKDPNTSDSQHDNSTLLALTNGQENGGKSGISTESQLQKAVSEAALKGVKGALKSCSNEGEGGELDRMVLRNSFRTKQFARKSTGCAQITARNAKRVKTTEGHQMEGNTKETLGCQPVEKMEQGEGMQVSNSHSTKNPEKVEEASSGVDRMETNNSLSEQCIKNAREIKPQEQGRGMRQKKKTENPNYVYFHKAPKPSKRKVSEKTVFTTTEKFNSSNNSHLLAIGNHDLTENDDELEQDRLLIVAALQAKRNCNPATKNGQNDSKDDDYDEEDDSDEDDYDEEEDDSDYDDEEEDDSSDDDDGPSVSSCSRTRPYVRSTATNRHLRIPTTSYPLSHFPLMKEAPLNSLETLPSAADYPFLNPARMKIYRKAGSDDFCSICLEQDCEVMVCCDFCQRSIHLKCHLPVLEIEAGEEKWRCPLQTDKEKLVENIPDIPGSADAPLDESNRRQFLLACSLVMKIYHFPESPTLRFTFPEEYCDMFGKLPFNLKYIRGRLGEGKPEPFTCVKDFLLAIRQMFIQSSMLYRKKGKEEFRKAAEGCFVRFLKFAYLYYPSYFHLFGGIKF